MFVCCWCRGQVPKCVCDENKIGMFWCEQCLKEVYAHDLVRFTIPIEYNLPPLFAGNPRSPKWGKVRGDYLGKNGICAVCGTNKFLNVHHQKPYHLFPELELEESNFITLCESPTHNCHFIFGHLLNWGRWNPKIVEMAKDYSELLKESMK